MIFVAGNIQKRAYRYQKDDPIFHMLLFNNKIDTTGQENVAWFMIMLNINLHFHITFAAS